MNSISFSSFSDELQKLAAEDSHKRTLKILGAGLGAAGLGAGLVLARRPGLRAHIGSVASQLFGGSAAKRGVPKAALEQAEVVASHLKAQGFDPNKHVIGVSGLGGSGKTTLAKELSKKLGIDYYSTAGKGRSLTKFRDVEGLLKVEPPPPGSVLDQTHLFNQVDPNRFDYMIQLRKPLEETEKQLMGRGYQALQADYYDIPKIRKSIDTAFRATKGTPQEVLPGVQVVSKPKGGWGGSEELDRLIRARNLNPNDPNLTSRASRVYAASEGKVPLTEGVYPYMHKGRVLGDIGTVGGTGALGAIGMSRMSDSKKDNQRGRR